MLYGWLEIGLSNNSLFRNENVDDIICRTIYDNKLIFGNTNGTNVDAAVYIQGNNVGIRKVPDVNVALDVKGFLVAQSLQVGLSNTPTSLTLNGDLIMKDVNQNMASTMELKCSNSNNIFKVTYNGTERVRITNGEGISLNDTLYVTNDVYAYSYQITSDQRLKQLIRTSDSNTDTNILKSLRVTDFEYKSRPGKPFKGLIAQEVLETYPQAVTDTTVYSIYDIKTIDMNQIVALNTSVLQSILSRLEALEKYVYENKCLAG